MNITEMVEMAKKSKNGVCWYSEKGPIYISKDGVMTAAFTNSIPIYEKQGGVLSLPVERPLQGET